MGTPSRYPQQMPRSRFAPESEPALAAEVAEVVALYRRAQETEAEYKAKLAKVIGSDPKPRVPIAYVAEQLGVERKTVYRHLGRPMK